MMNTIGFIVGWGICAFFAFAMGYQLVRGSGLEVEGPLYPYLVCAVWVFAFCLLGSTVTSIYEMLFATMLPALLGVRIALRNYPRSRLSVALTEDPKINHAIQLLVYRKPELPEAAICGALPLHRWLAIVPAEAGGQVVTCADCLRFLHTISPHLKREMK